MQFAVSKELAHLPFRYHLTYIYLNRFDIKSPYKLTTQTNLETGELEVKQESMYEAAKRGFSTATDLADYLVKKGIPFRDSHEIVGSSVAYGIKEGKDLSEMSLEELQQFSNEITEDVFEVLTLEGSVSARNHLGGTAPNQVREAAARASSLLKQR